MRIFGVSLLTIAIVLGAFYVGRKTGLLSGVFMPVTG
jgi:thiamine transporter ThiT